MYVNDKFHHKEWLDPSVFEDQFFEYTCNKYKLYLPLVH